MSSHDSALSFSDRSDRLDSTEVWHVKQSPVLSVQSLSQLNQRSDRQGLQQLTFHSAVMGISGIAWGIGFAEKNIAIAIPALIIYGFSLASMFAPLHECVHRTAFATPRINDAVAWLAGVLSFYNSTFYRRYHKWHHRYTQIPGKDPELEDTLPTHGLSYLWQMSGIPWWTGKIQGHIRSALGQFEGCSYVSDAARTEIMRSTWGQLGIYVGAIAVSLAFHQPWFILYWLLPLAVGQPILRFILIAEHTGCPQIDNPLHNTRTTLTLWPLRQLMWNMPFHAEHHLYASIPFHALPQAHEQIKDRLTQITPGYIAANRQILDHVRTSL